MKDTITDAGLIPKKSEDNIPHVYNGNGLQNIKCKDCGKCADDVIHYRNAGIICDTYNGPCSCGAWH